MRTAEHKKEKKKQHPCIAVNDVSFSYGAEAVLDGLSFTIYEGEYVGIVGPNGSGKSTLMKMILGLLEPTGGSVAIFGHSSAVAKTHYDIGYVPQRPPQHEEVFPATVREVIRSGRAMRLGLWGRFTSADEQAVAHAVRMADVGTLMGKRIGALSGGQRQRVLIARALAREPRILVLDEPTVGIDAASRTQFYKTLKVLNRKHGITILMVSHDLDALVQEVEYILCLENRKLVCHLPSATVRKHQHAGVRDPAKALLKSINDTSRVHRSHE